MINKISSRQERNAESVYVLQDFLRSIYNNPKCYVNEFGLISSLKSQAGAAKLCYKFESSDGEIKEKLAMSKNTLEKYADSLLDGGYAGLETLRKEALDAVKFARESGYKSNKKTKSGLHKKVKELEDELFNHKKNNMILLQGVSVAMWGLQRVKNEKNKAVLEKQVNELVDKLRAIVDLNSPPYNKIIDADNVVNLEMHKDV